jgi:zinc D-Ala-D-Ala carboxypeptidase
MSYREPARPAARRARRTIVAAIAVVSIAAVGYQTLSSSSSVAALASDVVRTEHGPALGESGRVSGNVTVFDDKDPAVTNLDPALLGALRKAATHAAGDGVEFYVNSGWRSRKYQEQLFQDAVSKYGSKEEAARWVAIPGTSAHESGDAVDLGRFDATSWLSMHGAAYGLCQIYSNEPWHYELRPAAIDHGCAPMYADSTQDPRMRQ